MKGNHKSKLEELKLQFKIKDSQSYSLVEKGHGRVEERTLRVMPVPAHLKAWPNVKQVLEMTRKRYSKGKESVETVLGITSLSPQEAPLQKLMALWRGHWAIENNLHRTRDEAFQEDRSTLRKGSSPQLMAALRNLVIHISYKFSHSLAFTLHISSRFPKRLIKFIHEN